MVLFGPFPRTGVGLSNNCLLSSRQPHGSVGPLHRGLQVRGERRSQTPPLPQQEEGLGAAAVCCPLLSDRSYVCFQSCARPQLGKWISCLATDSDWMVGRRLARPGGGCSS